jgi:hypothetical protein
LTTPCPQLTAADQAFTQAVAVLRRGDKGMTLDRAAYLIARCAIRLLAFTRGPRDAAEAVHVLGDELTGPQR